MIVNNTNVRGIWAYSDGLVFEPSDFVVKGDQIFICTSPGSMGDPEEHPELYTRYPGNMVSSLEEYKRIVEDPEGSDDLYVSSKLLHAVLQDMYFGLGDSGIIDTRIDDSGNFYLHKKLTSLAKEGTTLDNLLTAKGFNNGVVLVSRNLPDIQGVIGAIKPNFTNFTITASCSSCGVCEDICPKAAITLGDAGYSIDESLCNNCGACLDSCPVKAIVRKIDLPQLDLSSAVKSARVELEYVFLRQYTYKSGASGYLHRVQELVDPAFGKIYFRHSRQVSASGGLEVESTDWKSCLPSTDLESIEKELQEIRNYISKSNSSQDSVGFRFRSVSLPSENNGQYIINLEPYDLSGDIITVLIESVPSDPGKPKKTYTSTIDLSDIGVVNDTGYFISREVTLFINKEAGYSKSYVLTINSSAGDRYIIKDVYCREAIYGYTGYSV